MAKNKNRCVSKKATQKPSYSFAWYPPPENFHLFLKILNQSNRAFDMGLVFMQNKFNFFLLRFGWCEDCKTYCTLHVEVTSDLMAILELLITGTTFSTYDGWRVTSNIGAADCGPRRVRKNLMYLIFFSTFWITNRILSVYFSKM